MFIKDQWYAVLQSDEVKPGRPSAFKRLGVEFAFWRDAMGQVIASEDRCPHRQAKLSLGKVVDGCIECPFHGFQFDAEGACQLIPANGKAGPRPKIFHTKNWVVREEHGFIWLWNGEPRTEYPPVRFFTEEHLEEFEGAGFQSAWNTHYTRVVENLLDMAHLPFVHDTTIGRGNKTLVNGPFTVVENDTVYAWIDTQVDEGQVALRPSEMTRPATPWLLALKFPNVWMLRLGDKAKGLSILAPVDDENTVIYNYMFNKFSNKPALNRLIAKINLPFSKKILGQDKGVATSQRPMIGGLDSGDKFIPADRPILLYYNHRDKLLRGEIGSDTHDTNTAEYNEDSLIG